MIAFAAGAAGFWTVSFLAKNRARALLYASGIAVLAAYLAMLWVGLGRPPTRTLGETRLWYALLLPTVSLLVALRWRIVWPLFYGAAMSCVFLVINILRPDALDKTLMPALQSPWFVPHVVVYILAYAFLTASALGAVHFLNPFQNAGLWNQNKGARTSRPRPHGQPADRDVRAPLLERHNILTACDRAVWIGLSFLTMGLLFGALWAKEAWGHYWTWDPKETWAFLTWAIYLAYIHLRIRHPNARRFAAVFLLAAVAVLATCWFGVNYLPSAASSVHTYTQ